MKILKALDLEKVIFIDIETVRIVDKLEKNTPLHESWDYKLRYSREAEKFEGSIEEQFEKKAALYAEFAKIVCITIGKIKDGAIKLKSYKGDNEKELLTDFCNTLTNFTAKDKNTILAGHAIKGFDLPFIMRRCLINQVELPNLLDNAHLKPWELTTIDTLELWKSTGFYGASLLNIAIALGLPSPKSDINGSETSDVYYKEGLAGIDRIARYCEKDVTTVANIVRICRYESPLYIDELDTKEEKVGALERVYNTKKMSKAEVRKMDDARDSLTPDEDEIAKQILETVLIDIK